MKKLLLVTLVLTLCACYVQAQRAHIAIDHVSPHQLTTPGFTTNSVSAGLRVIPKGTYGYFSPMNIAVGDTNRIQSSTWTLLLKPTGSVAALENFGTMGKMFKADINGEYQLKLAITTATGTDDTTISLYASNFVGVGNFDSVAAVFPQCMSCHASMPAFSAIFDKWKVSGHANLFKTEITTGPAYYSTSCMKCHTTGYDHNIVAANNGFDDVAAQLGWVWYTPPHVSKWDSLKTRARALVNFATIGCENCHGAGSEHGNGGIKAKIQISMADGACAQCHDEPWRHNKVAEFENSVHAEAIWETAFATRTLTAFDLNQCMRCHSGKGYVMYTKGLTQATALEPTVADHVTINCATCHDPHGNTYTASLRQTPASGDTLGNGYNYTAIGGVGQTCMSCHKARRNSVVYQSTAISATWGPHYSVQTDVLFGQNAVALFDTLPYPSSGHKFAVANACVDCHMYPTADTGTVNRDKVGGHSWRLRNPENNYQHTKACVSCHGPKNTYDDFMAAMDYDQDGTVEPIMGEVKGLIVLLKRALPPVGLDTVIWSQIRGRSDSVIMKKAYWNLRLIESDGSFGMHNTKFSLGVLIKSIKAINNGVIPVELMAFNASLNKNVVALNWETATETNNKGFKVERNINGSWQEIAFVNGKGTTSEYQQYSYSDKLNLRSETKVSYRLVQVDFDGKRTLSKEIELTFVPGPQEYALSQNYPNPFNPTTTINFTVPEAGVVKVKVYDAMGNLVKELFNENIQSGTYNTSWNGDDSRGLKVASGIYFYKLEATNHTLAKKMILMK